MIQSLSEADVFLLACETFPGPEKRDEGTLNPPKKKKYKQQITECKLNFPVTEWCHVNKFELVDMEASESSDENMEGDKYGLERIVEALHTHNWPNRTLKGIPHGRISTSNEPDVSQVEDQLENIRLNPTGDPTEHMLMNSVLGIFFFLSLN